MKRLLQVLKRWCCQMDWHGPTTVDGHDGASFQGRCKWCGRRGLYDLNGDFFAVER
jgi:hypothetical protein